MILDIINNRWIERRLRHFLWYLDIVDPIKFRQVGENKFGIFVGSEQIFSGYYPGGGKVYFTLELIHKQKILETGISVDYIEAFVFRTDEFVPIEFVIHQYPQTQTTYLEDVAGYKKGQIVYHNSCPSGGGSLRQVLDKPIFKSELVDKYLSNLLD